MFHRTRFVLVESSHPGNIGAAARALKTMGCTRLILVKPRTPRAHQHPDALAMASGAGDVLARAEMAASLDEALADVQWSVALSARARRYGAPLFTPRQAAARARSLASTVEMAFVFGNERSGLSNADIERCRARVYIPASPAYNSLNLAQAVQVLTYELRLAEAARDSRLSGALAEPIRALASNEEIERMFAHFEQALLALDFFDPAQPKRLLPRLRRFFARTQLEHEEVSLMRGIAKAILQDRRIARVGIANQ
ncbi:putative tRNA/rRNA methyltransferase [Candidatus Glomeribacter gigasporarum BEG34]|uniref:tRNA (cytidine/uridine-2'-O-)-methyltransferase TrmJ n=1 Tax=Candidatus Glomeribacter gigasporarum BEG34 TaxID=1070319 RepID=G2JBH5_9BURK|nr:RNA methyltransferase [Candidatus Glomeribacter gigasporarum]CCD30129.1 putative tRNA/rRNA methyltransferase [Candidatus Glomeribacter gigasporarum BEG34]